MTSYALLFPGQGSQYVGMGQSFFLESNLLFEEAENILSLPLKKIMFQGPIEELTATAIAQPAILLHSIAALAYIKKRGQLNPVCALGHSLGEYSALVAAQVISFSDAIKTVHMRGKLMQEAVPKNTGAMLAVLGLDALVINDALKEFANESQKNYAAVANYNGPLQTVIAGTIFGVSEAQKKLNSLGAKRIIELNVSAPFHCALMKPAQKQMADMLRSISFNEPKFPIVSNVSANSETEAQNLRNLLIEQITKPVRFTTCVNFIKKSYPLATFIELGPKNILTGIIKRMNENNQALNVDSLQEANNFIQGSYQ
jgi:[acyl-carrier-protein] S-malonyltransferase